jgi:hypothetical protein
MNIQIKIGPAGSQWNATVHLPADYTTSTKTYPTIYFFPGLGEVGTNASLVHKYGPNAYIAQGWDGVINGHSYIIASLQCPAGYSRPTQVKTIVDAFEAQYRVDKSRVCMTGLSNGGWVSSQFVTYKPTSADTSYVQRVKAVVNVQGVKPDDTYASTPAYPQKFVEYAKSGGKFLGFEQKYDGRDITTIATTMNKAVAGSAIAIITSFGNGGHCCWNSFYGGGGATPAVFSATGNMYQWIDTKLYSAIQNQLPQANAGPDKEHTLNDTILLSGNAVDPDGTIIDVLWEQIAGPTAEILSPNDYTTQIKPPSAGVYTFRLIVIDNSNEKSSDEVTINVIANIPNLINTIKLYDNGTYEIS